MVWTTALWLYIDQRAACSFLLAIGQESECELLLLAIGSQKLSALPKSNGTGARGLESLATIFKPRRKHLLGFLSSR